MKQGKTRGRRGMIGRFARGLLIVILVLVAALSLVLFTTPGARLAAMMVNRLGSNEIRSIEVDAIGGLAGGNTRIGHLLISDAEGDPWLLLKGIEIDWSPTAIFTTGLKIERLRVDRVEFARLPDAGAAEENEVAQSLKLPLNIDVENIDIPDIILGEKIAGEVGRFAASGALRANSDFSDVVSDLGIRRIDGVGGEARLVANINLPDERFDLDFDFAEPAGGVLAHLAGLSKTDAVAIKANTAGRLSDWTLQVTGDINTIRMAEAEIAVRQRDNGHVFDATASGALSRFLPPLLAPVFAGNSDIIATGLLEPEFAGAQIDIFSLTTASLAAQGQGRLARDEASRFTATLSATNGPLRLVFPASGDKTDGGEEAAPAIALSNAEFSLTGTTGDARVQARISLPEIDAAGLAARQVTLETDLTGVDLSARSGKGTLRVDAGSVGSVDPVLARALAGQFRMASELEFDGETLSTTNTRLNSATTDLAIVGTFDLAKLAGSGNLDGRINSAVLAANLPETIGPDITVSGDFSLAENTALRLDNLELAADRLIVTGQAGIDEARNIDAGFAADLQNVAALNPLATGGLSLEAEVTGSVFAPGFSAKLTGRDITVDGKALEELELTADGAIEGAAPRAKITLSGRYLGQPITGSAELAQRNGRNEINPLELKVLDNRVSGALVLDSANRPTGQVDLDLPDIAALMALAGVEIKGQGQGRLVFSVEGDIPVLAADLAIAEMSGNGFSLAGAQANATLDNYLATPGIAGNLRVASVDAGGTAVRGVTIDLGLDGGWTRFDGKAQADGIPVSLAGRLRQGEGGTAIELDKAQLTYRGLPVRLADQARISVHDGITSIERLALIPGSGTINVAGTAGEKLDLDVRLASVPLSAVEAFAPGTGLAGAIAGSASITGTPSAPLVRYDLTASGVGASALAQFAANPLSVTASGTYATDAVRFTASARDAAGLLLNAEGSVGLTGAGALSVSANGNAPFSLVASQLAAQGLVLDGAANIDMRIGGTLASPDYNGTIRAANARFVDTTSGIAINNLATELALNRQSVELRSLAGELSSGGQLAGSGTISLAAESGYPADLNLRVTNGRYADGKLVATRFNAALTLAGPLTRQPVLGGNLDLDQTTITVPDALPGSISQLDVTHKNAGPAVQAQAERIRQADGDGAGGGLGLDLRINAPNRIFVRGRGIDAEFGGALTLRGSTASPRAIGGFELVRGRLDILGKRLDFDRGRITFAGSMIPTLDFAASTAAGSTTATVLVTGLATQPEFSFTSSPELPEDEVLALLIFGRSLSNLSPLQIAQLAGAAAELTGVTSGGGLVGQLRKATGIDNLDVKTDAETGQTSVAVGKYLNDRTYLGLEKGATAGSGKATIDLNIGRGLKLRGEASSGGETKGGIFFERDY